MSLRFLLSLSIACLFASVARGTPAHVWSHNYGDAEDQYFSNCFTDVFGNIILCANFRGSIDIVTPYTAVGSRDVIVAKFSPGGTPLWDWTIGFPFADTGWNATSDITGNVIVGGSTGPTDDERRAFIARILPTGVQQWIKHFSSGETYNAYVWFVATDNEKHIYAAGTFQNFINFGGSTLTSISSEDLFLAEFDALGNHIWSKRFGTFGAGVSPGGLAINPAGNVVFTGDFDGSINFGGSTLNSAGSGDIFLAMFSGTNGTHLSSKRFGGTSHDTVTWMDLDPSGRIALTGEIWSTMNFGGPPLNPPGGPDAYVAVLEADGDHIWSKVFGAGDREIGSSVAFASNNDVLLTVEANGTDPFNLGGSPMTGQDLYYDLCVARFFVANGAHRWSTKYTAAGGSTYANVVEEDGQLIFGGQHAADLNLGGGTLSLSGEQDLFVAKFADHLTGVAPTLAHASLAQNSPNPFNPTTRIEYTLVAPTRAIIDVYDAAGAVVARLHEGTRPAGTYSTIWNGRDADGRAVASGVYFYRLAGMPDVAAKKMVLLK